MLINIEGIRTHELEILHRSLDRMGFDIQLGRDEVQAVRPDVMTKEEFKSGVEVSGVDTRYYGGVAWHRLQDLYMHLQRGSAALAGVDLPLEFIRGSASTNLPARPNLLVVETIEPTAEVLEEHVADFPKYFGVNPRLIALVRSVVSAS